MRSIAGGAIDRKWCDRSQVVRSIVVPHAFNRLLYVRSQGRAPCRFDRGRCVRSHNMRSIADNYLRIFTAQELKRWNIGPARTTRETGVNVSALNRASCARSHQVRSIALSGVKTSTFLNFSPFEPRFAPRTYNILKH